MENKKDETPKEEVKKPEAKTPTPDSKEGSKYETTPVIELARKNAERLEAANKKTEELQDRQELIMAKQALGGESEAGQNTTPQYSDEEKASRARIKAIGDASGSSWAKDYV